MSQILKISNKDAIDKLTLLSGRLSEMENIHVHLDKELSVVKGVTRYDQTRYADDVVIGVKEIVEFKPEPNEFSYIPDDLFVLAVLTTYHEFAHCLQNHHLFRQKQLSSSNQKQLVLDVACDNNEGYYLSGNNYLINANEIQAEQYGIMNAYDYLCNTFTGFFHKKYENLVLDVVNSKMLDSDYGYFIRYSQPFKSIKHVEKAFDTAYYDSFHIKRQYDFRNEMFNDLTMQYFDKCPEAVFDYLEVDDPSEQDKFVAAVTIANDLDYFNRCPNLREIMFPVLQGLSDVNMHKSESKNLSWRQQTIQDIENSLSSENSDYEKYI